METEKCIDQAIKQIKSRVRQQSRAFSNGEVGEILEGSDSSDSPSPSPVKLPQIGNKLQIPFKSRVFIKASDEGVGY